MTVEADAAAATTVPLAIGSGAFVAVVGPSGAGKDSVIAYARSRLGAEDGFDFVHRVVTRPCDPASEVHDTMDDAAFRDAERNGAFSLCWRAHGLAYGLRRDVDLIVAAGRIVVANLSRTALDAAARRYARLAVAEITARPDILAARIAARGREAGETVTARLSRAADICLPGHDVTSLDNSGPIETAGEGLVTLLRALRNEGTAFEASPGVDKEPGAA